MGGRDHSVQCKECGCWYGGFNGPDECGCTDPKAHWAAPVLDLSLKETEAILDHGFQLEALLEEGALAQARGKLIGYARDLRALQTPATPAKSRARGNDDG